MAKLGLFIREHPEYLVANEDNIEEKIYHNNLAYVKVKYFFLFFCNYYTLYKKQNYMIRP